MNRLHRFLTLTAAPFFALGHAPLASAQADSHFFQLGQGWSIQSAALDGADGAAISSAGHDTAGWHPATVPTTVLGALVDDGVYTNIYFGTNLANIPAEQFNQAWWFRDEFSLSRKQAADRADLIFEGINYRANIWLNGEQIAKASDTFGAYRIFKLAVSGKLKRGKNVLAVEIFRPQPGDYTMGFVDWNPRPPDGEMGLFRPVKLHFYRTVALADAAVESKIDHATWQSAQLTVRASLQNPSDHEVQTTVRGDIDGVKFSESFTLAAGESRAVALTPDKNPALNFDHAQLWWPWELGEPHLYNLTLAAETDGQVSDAQHTRFGIREVSDYINPNGYRGYAVNGKKILIRGGGWGDELLLRERRPNLEAQLQYTKAMHLNTVRLEGLWGSSQALYDLADEYGLLVMAGWSCQWESNDGLGKKTDNFGGFKSEADMTLATNYLHDQVLWLRNHPSIYVWVLGSDKSPRPELESRYATLLQTIDTTRPTLMSCGYVVSKISGPSAVKMTGPYDYVTPNYWSLDRRHGGAFGYNTETSPGPEPPPLESLRRMLPADHLWPIDDVWNFHCGRDHFAQMQRYWTGFTNRYGTVSGVAEFAFKCQADNYEGERAMYEAFATGLPRTTGVVQWMLNPSWPRLYWQLYDYYLVPGGAYFGARRGANPVGVVYNYADSGIYLVNQTGKTCGNYRTTVTVYDLNSKTLLAETVTNASLAYGSQKVFDLAGLTPDTPVYFVDLHAEGEAGPEFNVNNFYWLSTKPDVLDEPKTEWFVTPNKSYADFTPLNQLPTATVQAHVAFTSRGHAGRDAEVTLANHSDTLAFFIEMRVVGAKSQQSLTPVFWDDNYVSLPPHTTRVFHAQFPGGEKPELKLQGWNVKFENQ